MQIDDCEFVRACVHACYVRQWGGGVCFVFLADAIR